jgi:peptidoglycan L-alanyl-D-glutamate endopeptidase CwlK
MANAGGGEHSIDESSKDEHQLVEGTKTDAGCKADEAPKKKDRWDKAQILSGFVSGVVLAVVGLIINASIQETQIRNSTQIANLQASSSKEIASIQASANQLIAENQRRLQESMLTGQFVQHLESKDRMARQLAVVALRRALPHDAYVSIICIVLQTDNDPEVRKTAVEQSGTLDEPLPCIAKLLAQAAQDPSKPQDERLAAEGAGQQLQEALLTNLKPDAASLARQLIKAAQDNNIEARLLAGYRSLDEQEELFKRKLTGARVSTHNTGLAFDVGIFENGKFLDGNKPREVQLYDQLGTLGKKLGLVWGGDWRPFVDKPHFETKDAQQELAKLRQQLVNRIQ